MTHGYPMRLSPLFALALVACSPAVETPTRPNDEVLTLGEMPMTALAERLPPTVVPCFGLHYGMLTTGEDVAADMVEVCERVPDSVGEGCLRYSHAVADIGRSPTDSTKIEAANEALKDCRE